MRFRTHRAYTLRPSHGRGYKGSGKRNSRHGRLYGVLGQPKEEVPGLWTYVEITRAAAKQLGSKIGIGIEGLRHIVISTVAKWSGEISLLYCGW